MVWTRRELIGGLAATVLCNRVASSAAAGDDGFITIEATKGTLSLAPPASTEVWGYNGRVPGPLLRVRQGEELKVRLVNKLAQPTSLTWHGVRNVNAMDGVAGLTQPPVPPGGQFEYRFKPPDAGLFWYHPHVFPMSAEQIGRGLYGLLIVDETRPPAVDHDLTLVVDDWALDAKGQLTGDFLDPAVASGAGRIGALVTANAGPAPGKPVEVRPRARVRLRILNACAARIAILTLSGAEALVVAIDGQPSEVFPPAGGTIPIGPGSRFELMIDMPPDAGKTPSLVLRKGLAPEDAASAAPLMTFVTKGAPLAARGRAERLPANALLPTRIALERSLKTNVTIGAAQAAPPGAPKWLWSIDGQGSDGTSSKPLFKVKRGGAVTIAFINKTAFAQQMHVHGHVFRILHDLDDGWDPYWRESILIAPGKTKHVAFVADNPGKWSIESLVLDRQVTGLAGWFEVA